MPAHAGPARLSLTEAIRRAQDRQQPEATVGCHHRQGVAHGSPRPSVEGPREKVVAISNAIDGDEPPFGEILAEEIIRELSRSPTLAVISRLSTTALGGRGLSTPEISAYLDSDYILTGSYRLQGKTIGFAAELAEAKSGRIVWTDRTTDSAKGLLSGERAAIGALVSGVHSALMSRELQRVATQPAPTLHAYTLLLAAITLMHRLSLRDFEQSRHLLQTLVDRPPPAMPCRWRGSPTGMCFGSSRDGRRIRSWMPRWRSMPRAGRWMSIPPAPSP